LLSIKLSASSFGGNLLCPDLLLLLLLLLPLQPAPPPPSWLAVLLLHAEEGLQDMEAKHLAMMLMGLGRMKVGAELLLPSLLLLLLLLLLPAVAALILLLLLLWLLA
jgi:hypothetical protein